MGKMKDAMIDSMNVYQVKEMLNNFNSTQDKNYVDFLETELDAAKKEIKILKQRLGPGSCVECFAPLPDKEIVCGRCQAELDGEFDHLKEDK